MVMVKASDAIRVLRMVAGISMSELARSTAVSIPLLSLIEKGERVPSMDLLKKISKVLQIPTAVFILLLSDSDDVKTDNVRANQIIKVVQDLIEVENRLRVLLAKK